MLDAVLRGRSNRLNLAAFSVNPVYLSPSVAHQTPLRAADLDLGRRAGLVLMAQPSLSGRGLSGRAWYRRQRVGLTWLTGLLCALVLLLDGPRTGRLADLGLPRAHAVGRRSTLEATLKTDRSRQERRRAAVELGELGDTDAVPALILAMFADRDESVRGACAESLAALAERSALPALRAATKDESGLVRRLASAAVKRLSPAAHTGGGKRVTVVVGRSASKAKSGTLPDIPKVLRDAVIKEMRSATELDVIEDLESASGTSAGFTVDSSVIKLSRLTTPAGELEVSCDVSMIIAAWPGRNVVSMVTGGASVIGPRGPSTKPTRAFIESLETEAVQQAVKETHSNVMTYLRTQFRK